jgi:hypothetical protein
MKILKTFESWNDNIIDKSLFSSGKAKYHPKVNNGVIKYKTGNAEPYYFAEIEKIGGKFVCKIYKKKKDGEEVRLRNKIKKELKLAHNYVREYLNQRLNKKKKKREKDSNDDYKSKTHYDEPYAIPTFEPDIPALPAFDAPKPKSKTVIRRY